MLRKSTLFTSATLIIALLGCAALAGCAAGQAGGNNGPLAAGGNTIAGPGAFNGASSAMAQTVFNTRHQNGLSLCATGVNVGTGTVTYFLGKDNGATGIWIVQLAPGQTFTGCGPDATTLTFTCAAEGGTCNYIWRVDQVR